MARELLRKVQGQVGPRDEDLRSAFLKFIGDFANWDLSADQTFVEVSRGLVKAVHPGETPLVVDPFAGGGSIPLEALRLGCEAFASDLNPVACLILKVMLEIIPRRGPALIEELRRAGEEVKAAADKELAGFYPADPDGAKPVAYLWARTVRCESPNCGAEIPLVRSFWLCNKRDRKWALRYTVHDSGSRLRGIKFEVFKPVSDHEVPAGTIRQARASCPYCSTVLPLERIRAQLRGQNGGAEVIFDERGNRIGGARLLAVALVKADRFGRHYRLASATDYKAVYESKQTLAKFVGSKLPNGLNEVPDESFHDIRPSPNARGLSAVTRYGISRFSQLYFVRQLLSLLTICETIRRRSRADYSNNENEVNGVETLLALTLSRVADYCSAQSRWDSTQERNVNSFGRQALPMVWDFAELVPLQDSVGSWNSMLGGILRVIARVTQINAVAGVQCADASEHPLPDECTNIWFTDPPYYDSVPYADLSDFFYVWLKRILPKEPLLQNRFEPESPLTPKLRECVWNRAYKVDGKEKDPKFFENSMASAFAEGRRLVRSDGVGCVVFAHKTTEGWEALLSGLIQAGWVVAASWPIATEQPQRLIARDSAALATSVHLICRPRGEDAPVGDWSIVLRDLPRRVADWMERLQSEGIRGADLVFACIGPALEIYSRYSKVVDAVEREIPLGGNPEATEPYKRGYLAYVWEVVGRAALEQVLGKAESTAGNGAAGALEEDARLTALFLWTLQSSNAANNGSEVEDETVHDGEEEDAEEDEMAPRKKAKRFSLAYDVVRRFAQPLGIHLPEWEGRIIEIEKGVVRLLPVAERTKQLFGEDGAEAVADRLERSPTEAAQLALFPKQTETETGQVKGRGRGRRQTQSGQVSDDALRTRHEATTLDRIHAAMLLQAGGRANALRALLSVERERGPAFLRLANALSALYPRESTEKRLIDAVILAVPR